MNHQAIHIVHLITGLEVGGAEMMLTQTVEHLPADRFRHTIVSFKGYGPLSPRLRKRPNVRLYHLDFSGPRGICDSLIELFLLLRGEQSPVVQTWLTHATFLGSLISWIARQHTVVWCLHTGFHPQGKVSRQVQLLNLANAWLSWIIPKRIISVSEVARAHCVQLGFDPSKMLLIPNGTSLQEYYPSAIEGLQVRSALGIPPHSPVIGIIGRRTPEKDFGSFFQAAFELLKVMPSAHFLLCGRGIDSNMPEAGKGLQAGLQNRFHYLGVREDMRAVYNACSLVALTSISEAFPLVLGEAMACGRPVAATDTGDCALLMGGLGALSTPGDVSSIVASWLSILTLPDKERGELSALLRNRIETLFSMDDCMNGYQQLYLELTECPEAGRYF